MNIEFKEVDGSIICNSMRFNVLIQNDGGWAEIDGMVTAYDIKQILRKMEELQKIREVGNETHTK